MVNSVLATRQSYGVWTAVANRDGEYCVRASTWTLVYYYHPRYNVWHTSPYSCISVMVPNSPHMAWVGPGESTFTYQVNRSIRWESNPDLRHGSQSRWPPYYYVLKIKNTKYSQILFYKKKIANICWNSDAHKFRHSSLLRSWTFQTIGLDHQRTLFTY